MLLPRQEWAPGGSEHRHAGCRSQEPHLDDFYVYAGFHAGKNI